MDTLSVEEKSSLNQMLSAKDSHLMESLALLAQRDLGYHDILFLMNVNKKAKRLGISAPQGNGKAVRVALIGGSTLFPLNEITTFFLEMSGLSCEIFTGEFNNYAQEIIEADSELYRFKPDAVFLLPSAERYLQALSLHWNRKEGQEKAAQAAHEILELCSRLRDRSGAEVLLANFMLPPYHDVGPYRAKTLGSEWGFLKLLNLELGLSASSGFHICDIEFLANRFGGLRAIDPRQWLQNKNQFSMDFLSVLGQELSRQIRALRNPMKKGIILDLDNTLWGGIVGDDGMEGIHVGETSPKGEAYRNFQKYIKSLKDRGVILAICSKNEFETAIEPFRSHPEMILRESDFVCIKANWQPKSENIRQIASELNLGLDSLVFVDDNPAEIEIVNQFVPEVKTILLSDDPSKFVAQLKDSRFFEPQELTGEDKTKTEMYQQEAARQSLQVSLTDMDAYLKSLEMVGHIESFNEINAPRIAQLINKSNQFNLTTHRRTDGEVRSLIKDENWPSFSFRLKDRFGDYGLISVIIAHVNSEENVLEIDTWLMSCRVLKRQVEAEVLNELARIAKSRNLKSLRGVYIPSKKNKMVESHYDSMGFKLVEARDGNKVYLLDVSSYQQISTHIQLAEKIDAANRSSEAFTNSI